MDFEEQAYYQQDEPVQQPNYDNNLFDMDISDAPVQVINTTIVSVEQQIRRDKLKVIEDERLKMVHERDQMERKIKQEKRDKVKQFLDTWKQTQSSDLQIRKKLNLENQQILQQAKKDQNDYKNSWEKIVANIVLKDGEYPGSKDVRKMRQAILNKRNDLNK